MDTYNHADRIDVLTKLSSLGLENSVFSIAY